MAALAWSGVLLQHIGLPLRDILVCMCNEGPIESENLSGAKYTSTQTTHQSTECKGALTLSLGIGIQTLKAAQFNHKKCSFFDFLFLLSCFNSLSFLLSCATLRIKHAMGPDAALSCRTTWQILSELMSWFPALVFGSICCTVIPIIKRKTVSAT